MQLIRTIDISGMGGGYEFACQKMLQAGEEFVKTTTVHWKEFEHGFGKTENAKALQEKMLDAVDRDCTGAMMGAVLGHLLYIQNNGREAWLTEAAGNDPERIFTWDGTMTTIPKADPLDGLEVMNGTVTPRTGKMQ